MHGQFFGVPKHNIIPRLKSVYSLTQCCNVTDDKQKHMAVWANGHRIPVYRIKR